MLRMYHSSNFWEVGNDMQIYKVDYLAIGGKEDIDIYL